MPKIEILDISLLAQIKEIIENAKHNIVKEVNNEMLLAYWNIGRVIVEKEQAGNDKADYGVALIKGLSKELTNTFGKGFSKSNLFSMRKLYLTYPKFQALSGKLTWSHYLKLLQISDDNERAFYEAECINSNWSIRELDRQIETSLYHRILLSKGEVNKEKVLSLAKEGIAYNQPEDVIKDPMVLEFLGVPENKPILESDLEAKLIEHIESFLLELGRGFMFVGSQQRISIAGVNYYVDMVFYNKILKTYVLIDLKIGKLKPENFGQMNMYINYYKNEVNDEGDNDPVGIILCAEKDKIVAEYSMEGLINNIYASKYTYVIPNKHVLENELQKVIEKQKKLDNEGK